MARYFCSQGAWVLVLRILLYDDDDDHGNAITVIDVMDLSSDLFTDLIDLVGCRTACTGLECRGAGEE